MSVCGCRPALKGKPASRRGPSWGSQNTILGSGELNACYWTEIRRWLSMEGLRDDSSPTGSYPWVGAGHSGDVHGLYCLVYPGKSHTSLFCRVIRRRRANGMCRSDESACACRMRLQRRNVCASARYEEGKCEETPFHSWSVILEILTCIWIL